MLIRNTEIIDKTALLIQNVSGRNIKTSIIFSCILKTLKIDGVVEITRQLFEIKKHLNRLALMM